MRVKLGEMDLITLDVSGTVLERLDTPATDAALADGAQASEDEADDEEVSGPIAIAVDVTEPSETTADNPAP